MPRALITGFTGFLGQELLALMSAAGWQTLLVGRTPPAVQDNHFVRVDFENPQTTLFPESAPAPDAIVHLASRVSMRSDRDSELFAPNALSTAIVAHWATRWGCPMILASSVSVYGPELETITPGDLPHPASAYGRSKLLAEQIVAGSGVEGCILRFAGIYGARGPRHLGINTAIEAARAGQLPVLKGRGLGLRNYIYVRDAATAIVQALSYRLQGVHLVAGSDTLSIAEMLNRICDQWLPGMSPQIADGREDRHSVVLGNFPFAPAYSFSDALRDIAGSS